MVEVKFMQKGRGYLCTIVLVFLMLINTTSISGAGEKELAMKQGPVEVISSTRQQVCLNGLWHFCPIENIDNLPSREEYGKIWVPGAWFLDAWWVNTPGIYEKGMGERWNVKAHEMNTAWYSRELIIPDEWKTGRITLDFERIATDAVVFIDGNVADTIHWPWGSVDITNLVKAGNVHALDVFVIAASPVGKYFNFMGTANAMVTLRDEKLNSKGITGEVFLKKFPEKKLVEDVFVQTSYRKNEIDFELELGDIPPGNKILIEVEIIDEKGTIEKKILRNIEAGDLKGRIINIADKWRNPRLWDLDMPNLYRAHVSVTSGKYKDEVVQEFGFREFWIEGKDFYLNGVKINLRPTANNFGHGMYELIDAGFQGLKRVGYNFKEIWPHDKTRRGMIEYNRQLIHGASRAGFLIAAPLPPATGFIMGTNWEYIWNEEGMRDAYEKKMLPYLKRIRNEPAIVMWTVNPNFFGHEDDQNPLVIGKRGWVKDDPGWETKAVAGMESINIIKKHDPTRPVFNHHGAYVGDVHTINMYLCLLPLQEREEWLSHYAKFGHIPFMGIEFGTPLECTMLRGRATFGENMVTEPLFTEYAASYFGNEAYLSETTEYRKQIKDSFIRGQEYKIWQGNPVNQILPSHQALQSLFVRNTWRSWRTYGISGGMNPWMDAHGWQISEKGYEKSKVCDFEPGKKGVYHEKVPLSDIHYLTPPYWHELPSAKAFIENNGATLAYLGGKTGRFTEKDHNFYSGETVHKQVVLINDNRKEENYTCEVSFCNGESSRVIFEGKGSIEPAGVKKKPFSFELPGIIDNSPFEACFILSSKIGQNTHSDTFNISIFAVTDKMENEIVCFDPVGLTSRMLREMGLHVQPWHGDLNVSELVIGRQALCSGYKLPANLEEYVRGGGRLLVMPQSPDWYEKTLGFRMSKYVSRYVFPVDANHPVMTGIKADNLKNWRGTGSLVEAYPDYLNQPVKEGKYGVPYYGWHWGNNGSVASSAFEKPHTSGWRPIFECEFDLAYTPLMETEYGKGKIILTSLDLEDNYDIDPAAGYLTRNLVNYLVDFNPEYHSGKTYYAGSVRGEKLLASLGVSFSKVSSVRNLNGLLIIDDKIDKDLIPRIEQFVNNGGKVLCLSSSKEEGLFGTRLSFVENFKGSLDVPDWNETEGLSVSDLRWRTHSGAWVISAGCDIGANGMLGRKKYEKGTVLFIQIDPDALDADSLTYFRYTRWRQTRAISQVLSNAGAFFESNDHFFEALNSSREEFDLSGTWLASLVNKKHMTISVISDIEDSGISDSAMKLIHSGGGDESFERVNVPMEMEKYGENWYAANGEVVFLKNFSLPQSFLGNDLVLDLGVINDYDVTFFNGEVVGKVEKGFEEVWGYERKYFVPAELVKPGVNTIAIRVFDVYGKGGLLGSVDGMCIYPAQSEVGASYYHPDYRDDFKLGDDPFRYFRW